MGEHTGDMEISHKAEHRKHPLQFRRLEAIAAHAGVDLHMDIHHHSRFFRHAVYRHGRIIGTDGRCGSGGQNLLNILLDGGGAEHENFLIQKSSVPQGHGIFRLGDAEALDSLAAEQVGHGKHPQAVGIGLEHSDQRGPAGFFPDDLQIVYDLFFFDHKPFHLLSPSPRAICFPVFLPASLSLWRFPVACPSWFSAHRRHGAGCAPFSFRRPRPD